MIYECEELGYCPHMSAGFVSCRDQCGIDENDEILGYSDAEILDALDALDAADNMPTEYDDEYNAYVERVRDRVRERF